MSNKFKLGTKVRDKVSGIEGIAVSEVTHLNGCVRYGVQPKSMEAGKMPDQQWFDIEQLEYIDEGVNVTKKAEPTGGDREDPPVRSRTA